MTIDEIADYILTHKPQAAYLGRVEMTDLRAAAEEAGFLCRYSHPIEYCGCPVFEVIANSHVAFLHKPENNTDRENKA
jgi:hypothetical protein